MGDHNPLYNSRITKSYLGFLRTRRPEVDIDCLLAFAGMSRQEIEDPAHWFTQQQVDRFHDDLIRQTGDPRVAREAGRHTTASKSYGIARQFLLGLISPSTAGTLLEKIYTVLSRGAVIKTRLIEPTKMEIAAMPAAGVKESPYQCENRVGSFEAFGRLFTGRFARVEHPECIHRGDARCLYLVSWKNTPALVWKRISRVATPLCLLGAGLVLFLFPDPVRITAVSGLVLAAALIHLRALRVEHREMTQTLETVGESANSHLEEINARYNNALLVQEIGRATAAVVPVDRLVATVMPILRKRLDFQRGLLFLADEPGARIEYKASYGYTLEEKALWRGYDPHFGSADGGGIFSRVFKQQAPIVIEDPSDTKERLSRPDIELAHKMDVRSMVCVPVVYEKKALGVLAADHLEPRRPLTQSDLNLFNGVASQVALSIVNARSFRQLRDSEAKYRLLATNVKDIIWVLDMPRLRFTYVSPSVETILGYRPSEATTATLSDILTPASYEMISHVISKVSVRKRQAYPQPWTRTLELELIKKDGTRLWSEITTTLIRDNFGRAAEVIGVAREITERKQAEAEKNLLTTQLQRAQKMKAIGTLAGGVAHDLNNILSGLVSYPELLLMQIPANSPLRKPIETIKKSGEKASAIVDDLLTLARRGMAVKESLSLNTTVAEFLDSPEHRQFVRIHPDIQIATQIEPALSPMLGSPAHLSKILSNLVLNAMEAMAKGGRIAISTRNRHIDRPLKGFNKIPAGEYVSLAISDTGPGIPENDLERIFEPFYTKKVMGRSGTGLGLAVVWGSVKDHGGHVDVESRPGKGTTFTLYFPVQRVPREKKAAAPRESYLGRGESILVVDDREDQREIAAGMLKQLGYKVADAAGGEAALACLRNHPADLVILDMIMDPGIDGLETFKRILEISPGQKAVLASGFSESERVKAAQRLGAGAYLKKPYRMEILGTAVRQELDR